MIFLDHQNCKYLIFTFLNAGISPEGPPKYPWLYGRISYSIFPSHLEKYLIVQWHSARTELISLPR
jgi:hypothetical protein